MFRNMATALDLLGGSLADVVRARGYVDDVRDFATYEAAAQQVLPVQAARTAVGSWGFPLPQAVVEADLVAVVGNQRRFYGSALPTERNADIAGQTKSAMAMLEETLGSAGLSLKDAVSVTVTLADSRLFAGFEETYRRLLAPPTPTRTVTAAPLTTADLLLRIDFVAFPGGGTPIGRGVEAFRSASPAMLAGDTLYVGGRTGAGIGVEAQTVAAWQGIEELLHEAGMELEDVVSTTNVLTDWRDYRAFNAGYARFVSPPYPPRTTISVSLMEAGARVQVEAVAHRQGRNARVIEVMGS
jgi:enamine deaminase RidA (YjgF/YER057c/UK114 family)